jgi:RimJ/RimL family protein N-acetyltransferase
MHITYRKLIPEDVRQYRDLRLQCLKIFLENFGAGYEAEAAKPKLYFENHIEQQASDKFMVGAFDGDKIIGICGLVQETGLKEKHKGAIVQMCLLPAYHGKGAGLGLLQKVIETAFEIAEVNLLLLTVVSGNTAAIKTYEKAGFKQYGLLPNSLKMDNTYLDERMMYLFRADKPFTP